MKWIEILKRIADNGMSIFTVSEFRRATDLSEIAAQKFLERYAKRGLLTRLKKGMYIVTDNPVKRIEKTLAKPRFIFYQKRLDGS